MASDADLDATDRAIVNAFQGGFPIAREPFEPAAAALRERGIDLTADELLDRVRRLDEAGVFSRFGPLINADEIGGATTLVAMRVPEDRYEAVAEQVNAHVEVAHNYERDHELNMWFVVSVVDAERIEDVLSEIERETGLETYDMPKLREFRLEAIFPIEGPLAEESVDLSLDGWEDELAEWDEEQTDQDALTADERDLLVAIQGGFPLSATPYADVAAEVGASVEWTLRTVARFLAEGKIRRIGVVPNHYALGYTENGMTVWDVPDDAIEEVGMALASLPFVTHCYERPRHEDVWSYNLFAMVHGRTEAETDERIRQARDTVFDLCGPVDHETLYSTRILKKTGIRLVERVAASGSDGA